MKSREIGPATGGSPTRAQRLAALMLTAFIDTLGVFLILALLPFYAQAMGATPGQIGLLVSAFAVAQMLAAPLWGRLSDRFGRRPIILLGLAISTVAYLTFAFADSLSVLLISRVVQGIGGGTVSVVFAYISETVEAERRAEGIGWVTSATSAAAMVGPALGSLVGRWDPSYPGLAAGLLGAVGLIVAWRVLPEPTPAGPVAARESLLRSFAVVFRRPLEQVNVLIWLYALGMLATNAVMAVAGLFLARRFGVNEDSVWWFFTCLAGTSLIVRALLLGPIVRKMGEVRVLRLGIALLGVGLLAMSASEQVLGVLLSVAVIAAGSSFFYPSTTALISRSAGRNEGLGQLLGVQQGFGGMSRIVGPLAAGFAFGALGPAAPIQASGAIALLATGVALWLLRDPSRSAD